MHFLTRISYNTSGWTTPTGEAAAVEQKDTFNAKFGFGHEDWLFRTEWTIGGWRYGFIQGVNRSADSLESTNPFSLVLFTRVPGLGARLVASIQNVEMLQPDAATAALTLYKRKGWLTTMRQEVTAIRADVSGLGANRWARSILNVRFRSENISMFGPDKFFTQAESRRLTRYQLQECELDGYPTLRSLVRRPSASSRNLPADSTYIRRGGVPVEVSPEHARMQRALISLLKNRHPKGEIRWEDDCVDVSVNDEGKLSLYEIKSDLDPRLVIRAAIGQLLEYGFHRRYPRRNPDCLIIVGRECLDSTNREYLEFLKTRFQLPIDYMRLQV